MDGSHAFGMAGVNVFLAMPTHRDLSPYTVRSLMETQSALGFRGLPATYQIQYGSSLAHHARTKVAWEFLKSDCTHLFWVDSDMVWTADDFLRLMALGTRLSCVGATYTSKCDPAVFAVYPVDKPGSSVAANEYGCLPMGGFGLGFTVIQRQLMERLARQAPKARFPDVKELVPYIFRCDTTPGWDGVLDGRGEDMAFFADVRALGETVWLDPSITLGHVGAKTYQASIRDHITKEQ